MTQSGRNEAGPVSRLVDELHKLPGIGPKTAQRLAYYLIRMPDDEARALAEAIGAVKDRIVLCTRCFDITEADPCNVCQDTSRDRTRICVVEEPLDVRALERTRSYDGLYHVLHGVISPINGIGPDNLRIRELLERLKVDGPTPSIGEIVIATNPNVEGEATAMYLQRLLADLGTRITRPARGLPVGGDLEYADEVTLSRAMDGRQPF